MKATSVAARTCAAAPPRISRARRPAPSPEAGPAAPAVEETPGEASTEVQGDGISSPKTMSGMSILGNEETPKSLVIVPWKSSEMGDAIVAAFPWRVAES